MSYLPQGSRIVNPTPQYLNNSIVRSVPPQIISSKIVKSVPTQQPQEDDEDLKSDKRLVNLCILILPFVLAVLFVIGAIRLVSTSLNTTKELEGSDNVLHYVHKNLNANPILQWANSQNGNCPANYQEAEIGEWQGIENGCICKNGDVFKGDEAYKCLKSGCDFQNGESDEDIEYWTSDSVRFCERRVGKENWQKSAVCDDKVDTLCANSVCIKGLNAQCPPNQVKVNNLSDPSASLTSLLKDFGTDGTSAENIVVIRESEGNDPSIDMYSSYVTSADKQKNTAFVEFQVSQGKTICLNHDFAQTTNQIYPLDTQQSKNKACDQYGAINTDQITVLDSALQSKIFGNNEDLKDIYTADNLTSYNPDDYKENQVHLLAVEKIPLASKDACTAAFDGHLSDSGSLAYGSRRGLRIFSWILLVFSVITVLLGILFLSAALFKKVSNENETKQRIAKLYWYSAWVLVVIALIIFLVYHIVFSYWLGNNEDQLTALKAADCFPGNPGINFAIEKLITFDSETANKFGPYVTEFFWYAIGYSLIWMAIIGFWKVKYSQVKNLIGN